MDTRHDRQRSTAAVAIVICAGLLAGCSSQEPAGSAERFIPAPEQAESALKAVFEAWRKGSPPGLVPDTSPAVHITDTYRKDGEQLVDYRILGEVPSERKRCYAVELRFAPERAERTRFLVVGIDPLWVFRLEDAELLAHWEHKMDEPASDEPVEAPRPADLLPEPSDADPQQ